MSNLMSWRAYARHRGCHHSSVAYAVKSGRIPTVGRKIDPAAADRAWASNTDISKPRNSVCGDPKLLRGRGASEAAPPSRAHPQVPDAPRSAEQRRLARILGGLEEPNDAGDREWLAVMDEREALITRAAESVIRELAASLLDTDPEAVTEVLDEALLGAEDEWRRRYHGRK